MKQCMLILLAIGWSGCERERFDAPELEPPVRAATPEGLLASTRGERNEIDMVIERWYHPDGGVLDGLAQVDLRLAEFETRSEEGSRRPCLDEAPKMRGLASPLPGGESFDIPIQCEEFVDDGQVITTGTGHCSDARSDCGLKIAFGIDERDPSRFSVAELAIDEDGSSTMLATTHETSAGTAVDFVMAAWRPATNEMASFEESWLLRIQSMEDDSLEIAYAGLHGGDFECGIHALASLRDNLFYVEGIFSTPVDGGVDGGDPRIDKSYCELRKQPDGTTPELVQLCMNADDLSERDLVDCTEAGVSSDAFELPVFYATDLDMDTMAGWSDTHWDGIETF